MQQSKIKYNNIKFTSIIISIVVNIIGSIFLNRLFESNLQANWSFSVVFSGISFLLFMGFTSLPRFITFIHEYGHYIAYKIVDKHSCPSIYISETKSLMFFICGKTSCDVKLNWLQTIFVASAGPLICILIYIFIAIVSYYLCYRLLFISSIFLIIFEFLHFQDGSDCDKVIKALFYNEY